MNLVLLDLDNTLLSGDTDVEWLDFLVEQGVLPASEHEANHEMDRRYASGEASTLEYVRFYLGYYRAFDMARLLGWRKIFLENKIRPLMLPALFPSFHAAWWLLPWTSEVTYSTKRPPLEIVPRYPRPPVRK